MSFEIVLLARLRAAMSRAGIPILLSLLVVSAPTVAIAQSASVEQRLARMERLLASDSLLKMFQTVETLKLEVRNLRGEIEVQGHQLKELRKRQTEMYLDVDKRLQSGGAVGQVSAGAVSGSTPQPGAGAGRQPNQVSTGGSTLQAGSGAVPLAGTGGTQASGQAGTAALPSSSATGAAAPARSAGAQSQVTNEAAGSSTRAGTNRLSSVSPGTRAASGQPAPDESMAEQAAYKEAFGRLKAGQYESAIGAFQGFLASYGTSEFADNAQYWLGETYYVTRQYEPALREFQKLLAQYPDSKKKTHAMLKIGYIYDELGQASEARRVLTDLSETYPKTTSAGLARKRLQRLRSE